MVQFPKQLFHKIIRLISTYHCVMKIRMQQKGDSYQITFKTSFFQKISYSDGRFCQFFEKGAEFFEKRSYNTELRSTTIKLKGKKYHFYEEKRERNVDGVIEVKKLKFTWAFLCYINEQINDFIRSDEEILNLDLKSY